MKQLGLVVLPLYVACGLSLGAQAQTIYRCGNSYSQTPCAGGTTVDTAGDNSRDKSQKAQNDAAVQRELKAANMLEKSRLQQEAAQARAARQLARADERLAPAYDPALDVAPGEMKNGGKSKYFTARAPAAPKKNNAAGHEKSSQDGTAQARP